MKTNSRSKKICCHPPLSRFRIAAAGMVVVIVLPVLSISIALSAEQKFTQIDVPRPFFTEAFGINPQGDIVETFIECDVHAFVPSAAQNFSK
jgi:hypothetical protein